MEDKEIKSKKNKPDMNEKSFIMDINIMESPIFMFKQQRSVKKMKYWLESNDISKQVREKIKKNSKFDLNSPMEYMKWEDSSGGLREFCVMSMQDLPSGFEQDIFYALVSLLIKQQAPVKYDSETGTYDLRTSKVRFNMSEITDKLGLKRSGVTNARVEDALERMKVAQYYGFGKGVFYDKETGKHIINKKSHFSLINNVEYQTIGSTKFGDLYKTCTVEVEINSLVLSNIRYSFIKFLNESEYFGLNSGLTRRIYTYIEGNKYSANGAKAYLKVSYEVLKRKIPIEATHNSRLKARIKKSLEELMQKRVISDYFYADEYKVNGIKENYIYFIFKGTKSSIIKYLEDEYKKNNPGMKLLKTSKKENLEDSFELVFPEDIEKDLIDLGINDKKIKEIITKYSKWKIAEYILWIKDGISKGKVKDPAAMFVFAITDEMVKVGKTHSHIIEFVERIKLEVEGKSKISKELIDLAYREYIGKELALFKEEEEFMYEGTVESIIDDIEKVQEKRIKSQRQLYNSATTDKERDDLLKIIGKWEKFSVEREKSEIFIEMFVKKIKLLRGLKDYEEFKHEYVDKNK